MILVLWGIVLHKTIAQVQVAGWYFETYDVTTCSWINGTFTMAPSCVSPHLASASNFSASMGAPSNSIGVSGLGADRAPQRGGWPSTFDPTRYWQASVTFHPGYVPSIVTFEAWVRNNNVTNMVREWRLAWSYDDFTILDHGTPGTIASLSPTGGSTNSWSFLQRTLSLASLLPATSQTLTFRLYGWNGLGWMVDSVRIYDASPSPLPITLTHFAGKQSERSVELDWATASEEGNDYFSILRSSDGENWEETGRLSGAGDSRQRVDYRFVDGSPLSGISYYKLRQTDFDGKSEDSQTIAILFREAIRFRLHPSGELWTDTPTVVLDLSGRVISEGVVHHLPSGVYLVSFGEGVATKILVP